MRGGSVDKDIAMSGSEKAFKCVDVFVPSFELFLRVTHVEKHPSYMALNELIHW